ncbi:MAG: hypothetical protein JJT94_15520, partial [Bernardetiaceae bacterium]|nr:hypothetical protein [Bernardetiaceae bacterium]
KKQAKQKEVEHYRNLYEHFISYEPRRTKVTVYLRKNRLSILSITGNSSNIPSVSDKRLGSRKQVWFLEHVLTDAIPEAKETHQKTEYLEFLDKENKWYLFQEIAKQLELYDYQNIIGNEQKAKEAINKNIIEKLNEKSIILPILITEKESSFDYIINFLEEFTKNTNKDRNTIKDTKSKHSFIIALLFQSEKYHKAFAETYKETYEIEVAKAEKECIEEWVLDTKGYLQAEKNGFCKPIWDEIEKLEPECQTQEKLFENITQKLIPDMRFIDFLKSNYFQKYKSK